MPKEGIALDMPCGNGRVSGQVDRDRLKIVGMDFSPDMLKGFRDTFGFPCVRADIFNPPFGSNRFNVILCIRFFQHQRDIRKVLQSASNMLKPGGAIIFETYLWSLKAFWWVDWVYKGGRVFAHDAKDVKEAASGLPLEVEGQEYCFLLSPFIYRFLPRGMVRFLDQIEKKMPNKWKTVTFWKLKKV